MIKKKVIAYFDGSNFYHLSKINYNITKIKFDSITNSLLKQDKEELIKIKYYNSPVSQQEVPISYSNQLKFFEKLKKTPKLELYLGRLVKRPLNKINIVCSKCGFQKSETLVCPKCGKTIDIEKTYKSTEKGIDVQIAITLLLDALENKYDAALLFSGDADLSPSIRYVIKNLKKEIIFCYFPKSKTSELIQTCSGTRIINKAIMERSRV